MLVTAQISTTFFFIPYTGMELVLMVLKVKFAALLLISFGLYYMLFEEQL